MSEKGSEEMNAILDELVYYPLLPSKFHGGRW